MLMKLFLIYGYSDEYLGKSISRDMEVYEMPSCRLDMYTIGELDVFFLESDIELVMETTPDGVLVESTEYFFSFSLECEFEFLSIELFLYFECSLQSESCLVFGFFGICFDLFETIRSHFSSNSLGDHGIASLGRRYFYDGSFSSEVSDILEEFDHDLVGCHRELG
jgi:hypothetical protein